MFAQTERCKYVARIALVDGLCALYSKLSAHSPRRGVEASLPIWGKLGVSSSCCMRDNASACSQCTAIVQVRFSQGRSEQLAWREPNG